jgi:hypothetical protein
MLDKDSFFSFFAFLVGFKTLSLFGGFFFFLLEEFVFSVSVFSSTTSDFFNFFIGLIWLPQFCFGVSFDVIIDSQKCRPSLLAQVFVCWWIFERSTARITSSSKARGSSTRWCG